jgi:proteasome accessory factor C
VYYSARRDERTHRSIDPHAVFSDRGDWYVIADDSASGEQRTFRIDRIEEVHPTGETFVRRDVAVPVEGFFADSDLPEVTVLLPADASWVAERYPVRATAPQADGRLVAVLAVSGDRWLERLLLRAGPHAQVLSPVTWVDSAARAAQRVLARYR